MPTAEPAALSSSLAMDYLPVMTTNPLRDLLNERRWHAGDLDQLVLEVRHRGAPDDVRMVPGHAIREIGSSGLILDPPEVSLDEEDEDDDEGELHLPWHRVLMVRHGSEVLWRRTG